MNETQPDLFSTRTERRKEPEFDLTLARLEGELGMEQVAKGNVRWIELAREVARAIAKAQGTVTADDVRHVFYARGHRPEHPNAWGAVFRGSGLRWTGAFNHSAVVAGHGNLQRVWELEE